MPYGQIVAVHGANISISVQAGGRELGKTIYLDLTLPAYNSLQIDHAIENIGAAVKFSTLQGKVWFPDFGVNERISTGNTATVSVNTNR